LDRLRELGLESLNQEADYYGLSLALGGGEVDLLSLTTAYAALGDGGRWRPRVLTRPGSGDNPAGLTLPSGEEQHIFSPGAAFLTTDILSDPKARITGFGLQNVLDTPYPAAVKTGTSKSFRDNWCVGYTGSFVVGVWAGNFEASPMDQVSGVTGAGAVWRKVSDLLADKYPTPRFEAPGDVISALTCPVSGLLAGTGCPNHIREYFLAGQPRPEICDHTELSLAALGVTVPIVGLSREFGLIRPLNGEIFAWDPGIKPEVQRIKALVQSVPEVEEVAWRLNGREIKRQAVTGYDRVGCLMPPVRGPVNLEVLGLAQGQVLRQSQINFLVR